MDERMETILRQLGEEKAARKEATEKQHRRRILKCAAWKVAEK